MKNLKSKLIAAFATLALAVVPVAAIAAPVAAQNIEGGLCAGSEFDVNAIDSCDPSANDAEGTVNDIIKTVINIFSLIVGVVSVIMIIVGGFRYITSGGDSGNVSGAKNTILFAVVGLVIVALAQVIVQFVLEQVQQ